MKFREFQRFKNQKLSCGKDKFKTNSSFKSVAILNWLMQKIKTLVGCVNFKMDA